MATHTTSSRLTRLEQRVEIFERENAVLRAEVERLQADMAAERQPGARWSRMNAMENAPFTREARESIAEILSNPGNGPKEELIEAPSAPPDLLLHRLSSPSR